MTQYIREPARRVKVAGRHDVVVVGGGPAGLGAAVAAGRNGAKVMLIEQTACLGGMGTAGLVPCFAPYSHFDEPLHTGIALEVVDRLKAAGGVGKDAGTLYWVTIDAEKLKRVYDQMLAESGAKVLFMTFMAGAVRRKDRVKAVIIENKTGRQAVAGEVFVDATGDADLAALAGVGFEKGDDRGRLQGVSLEFTVAGADCRRYWAFYRKRFGRNARMNEWLQACERKGQLPRLKGAEYRVIAHKEIAPGTLGYNFGHVFGIDGTDVEQVSCALARGREIAHNYVEFARRHIPGMDRAHIVATGSLLGVRETRRIKGRYRLVVDDFLDARHFADDVALSDYPVDVHPPARGKGRQKATNKWYFTRLPAGESFGIPYRCMLPRTMSNLLVPGRAASSDRPMQGTIRTMPACLAMGQAAGTAAVLAIRRKTSVAKVDPDALRKALATDGVKLVPAQTAPGKARAGAREGD